MTVSQIISARTINKYIHIAGREKSLPVLSFIVQKPLFHYVNTIKPYTYSTKFPMLFYYLILL
nr:MAG TPA: hypothetical protein [Caudoviricetes sp.]